MITACLASSSTSASVNEKRLESASSISTISTCLECSWLSEYTILIALLPILRRTTAGLPFASVGL